MQNAGAGGSGSEPNLGANRPVMQSRHPEADRLDQWEQDFNEMSQHFARLERSLLEVQNLRVFIVTERNARLRQLHQDATQLRQRAARAQTDVQRVELNVSNVDNRELRRAYAQHARIARGLEELIKDVDHATPSIEYQLTQFKPPSAPLQ
ncbi:unnamed protein product, partial [Mesorhabditis spiculigera]